MYLPQLLLPLLLISAPWSSQAPPMETEADDVTEVADAPGAAQQARFEAEVRAAAQVDARRDYYARWDQLDGAIRRHKIRAGLSFGMIVPAAYVGGIFGCLAGASSENSNMDCGVGGIIGGSITGSLFLGLGIMHVIKVDKLRVERRMRFGYMPQRGGGTVSAQMRF